MCRRPVHAPPRNDLASVYPPLSEGNPDCVRLSLPGHLDAAQLLTDQPLR